MNKQKTFFDMPKAKERKKVTRSIRLTERADVYLQAIAEERNITLNELSAWVLEEYIAMLEANGKLPRLTAVQEKKLKTS